MKISNLFRLGKQLFLYWLARRTGFPKTLPTNLTLNVTYRCNSRCLTCNIWKKQADELSLTEWKKIFKNYNSRPFWLILSGGEPFLRRDLVELTRAGYHYLKPAVINIPTNGILYKTIPQKTKKILKNCPHSEIVINFSMDGVGKDHDKIRNTPGNFEKLIKSFQAVKELKRDYTNLTIGLHTVISKYNVKKIPKICDFALSLEPDQYITEIAEQRVELDTQNLDTAPSLKDYSRAIDYVSKKIFQRKFQGLAKATEALRPEYYQLVKKILRQKTQVIPCYAGWASAQISADGEVWPCCVRGDNLGNLRDNDYDFAKIWFSPGTKKVRRSIRNKECFCPLASTSYTNMILSPRSSLGVLKNFYRKAVS